MPRRALTVRILLCMVGLALAGCGGKVGETSQAASSASPVAPAQVPSAPPATATGGFDGQQAYQYVSDIVAIGPHSAGTEGGKRVQQYIVNKLQSFGCMVDEQSFNSGTPIGTVAMMNIVAKAPGASPDILMFTTHYDSKLLPNFVGADDGGSSTGVMLEFARLVCQRKNALTVWIAFFDGEEAFNPDWQDPDNTYGSREMAARMALSGDLKRVKAFVLADLVGSYGLRLRRESYSTPWLRDLVWNTAKGLGYGNIFVAAEAPIEDDHQSFLKRQVPSVDLVRCCNDEIPYWHTSADTLDKIDPRSLAVVGHVLIATLPALEQKFDSAVRSPGGSH